MLFLVSQSVIAMASNTTSIMVGIRYFLSRFIGHLCNSRVSVKRSSAFFFDHHYGDARQQRQGDPDRSGMQYL